MSSIAIASSKVFTAGSARASPIARAQFRLQHPHPRHVWNSVAHPTRNPSVGVGDRSREVAAATAAPGGHNCRSSGDSVVGTLGGNCSALKSSTKRRRRVGSFVPARAATGVAAAEGSAADSSSTATATTTGNSEEEVWRKGESYFLTDSRPVVLFDGICNFCNTGVNFLLDNDPEGKFRLASLQSDAGKALLSKSGRSPDDLSSIVLVYKDRSYIKSEAVLRMARDLRFPYSPAGFIGFLFPLFVRDAMYDQVANNRYDIFGTTKTCRRSDPRFPERFVE